VNCPLRSAFLHLEIIDRIEPGELKQGLAQRVNRPRWPVVEITIAGSTLSCGANTWEPLLRVRVEDALEEILGSLWRDTVALAQETGGRNAFWAADGMRNSGRSPAPTGEVGGPWRMA
jgi:hypothetical protein